MPPDPIDQWLPRRGQCLICNVPGADQRHRVIEAIADLFGAGETEEDIAAVTWKSPWRRSGSACGGLRSTQTGWSGQRRRRRDERHACGHAL